MPIMTVTLLLLGFLFHPCLGKTETFHRDYLLTELDVELDVFRETEDVSCDSYGLCSTREPPKTFSNGTLQYMMVMSRHGSRSPTSTYPTDPYPYNNSTYWPDGPGELTKLGKQQLYQTGQYLRRRYSKFLSPFYRPNDTKAMSSDVDRDYQSAGCLLASLYPPVGYQVWDPFLNWQPIPVYLDPLNVVNALDDTNYCPRLTVEVTKLLKNFTKTYSKYTKLFQYINKYTRRNNTPIDVANLWDTWQMQYENGFNLPTWTKAVFPNNSLVNEIRNSYMATFFAGSETVVRLEVGRQLERIGRILLLKAMGKAKNKIDIDLVHDSTIISFLAGLGYLRLAPVQTSAYFVIELHQASNMHYVKVLYFNDSSTVEPMPVPVSGCGTTCSLHDFTSVISKMVPSNWVYECHH